MPERIMFQCLRNARLSGHEHKYDGVCCAQFGLWRGARRAHPPAAVTDEQRSHRPNSAQPEGRPVFLAQASLFAPYRPLAGMLVAHASPAPKIPVRKRHRIYVHDHLAGSECRLKSNENMRMCAPDPAWVVKGDAVERVPTGGPWGKMD